ncbi:MAG: hypothetical protein ABI763_15920 [Bacteroidota bacterium]
MNEDEHLKTLSDIRNLMERSSRFLSLSGLSGIFIGIYALVAATVTWWYLGNHFETTTYYNLVTADVEIYKPYIPVLAGIASAVLLISLLTGYILTQRFTKKKGLKLWDTTAKRMLINLLIPLVAGGIFCLLLLFHHDLGMVAPSMLIFYGLALLNAGKYTFNDIRYLGMIEITIGLIAAVDPGYGLVFWAIGFGILHILYGITMYFKYER